jgi:type IV pilus assembly protein PilN
VITINLAPSRAPRKGPSLRFELPEVNLGVVFAVLYVVAVSGLTVYWAQLYREEVRLTEEVVKSNTELERLKPITAQQAKVKEHLAELQKRVKTIDDLTKDQSKSIRMLNAFSGVVPNDLWVTRMEERGKILKVSGTAFSAAAVSDLMTNLRASGKFKEIDIVISKQELAKSPRLVTFEVTCRFEG